MTTDNKSIWLRGLHMVLFSVLIHLSLSIMVFMAFLQFLWMLFTKGKNQAITEFGTAWAKWLLSAVHFLIGKTEDKPFPWKSHIDHAEPTMEVEVPTPPKPKRASTAKKPAKRKAPSKPK